MDANNKMMKASTSEKGKSIVKDLNVNFDTRNQLYYHKWDIPANTVGTMSSPNFRVMPGDLGVQDATLAIRPKIVRPLSALSIKKTHYNAKPRPASASSFVFTFHHYTPSIVVDKKPEI